MPTKIQSSILASALQEEWRIAVSRLSAESRALLQKPLFSVVPDLGGKWGQWRGGKIQCIELVESLILRHPWFAVVDVVRHETAHQAIETLFPGIDEPSHGPRFLEMCKLLGARPQASGSYPLLDEIVYSDQSESDQQEGAVTAQSRLLLKIRKLLSLSESANENEAKSALLKARELEARYVTEFGESASRASAETEFYTIGLGPLFKRISVRESVLGSILQEFYHVRVIWENVPDVEAKQPGAFRRQLSLSGSRKDLRIATYVYDCLNAYISHAKYELPSILLAKVLTSAKVRQDFEIGVLTGFQSALREQSQRPEMRALVLSDHTHLDEYCRWAFPHLRRTTHNTQLHSQEARAAGEVAGRKFQMHPGLDTPDKPPRQLHS